MNAGVLTTVLGRFCPTSIQTPTYLLCSSALMRLSRLHSITRSAKRLAPLRDEGILITGSGNVAHNLHTYAWGRHAQEPYDWTMSFENRVRELLLAREHNPLVDYEHKLGGQAVLAVPTPDHYLPLLYVIATRTASEPVTFPVEGVDGGLISMLGVQAGIPCKKNPPPHLEGSATAQPRALHAVSSGAAQSAI